MSELDAGALEIPVEAIDEDFVARFRDTVAAVELDGEAVLLDGDTGSVHTFNPTATLVWQCCDGTSCLRDIIDDLAFVFDDIGRGQIAADVLELARAMGRQGLLVGVQAEPASAVDHEHHHDHDHGHDHGHDHHDHHHHEGQDAAGEGPST
jgi:hypothetical protein